MHAAAPLRRLALLLVLASVAACSSATRQAGPPQPETTVRVENRNWLDMNIYVLRAGGQRIRLGQVTGSSTRTLRIPSNLIFGATPLQFIADPIGGGRLPVTQSIVVVPGDEVVLQIPNS
jgi:hypothetical protein